MPLSADVHDRDIFAALYFGGTPFVAIPVLTNTNMVTATMALTAAQIATICYLGLIASGLGFFL